MYGCVLRGDFYQGLQRKKWEYRKILEEMNIKL